MKKTNYISKLKWIIPVLMVFMMLIIFMPEVEAGCNGKHNYPYPNKCGVCGRYWGGPVYCKNCGKKDTREPCEHESSCDCCGRTSCSCYDGWCSASHCSYYGCMSCGHSCGGGCSYSITYDSSGHWYYCNKNCGSTYGYSGHSGSATCTSNGTCGTCGYTHSYAYGHSYTSACCDYGNRCSSCGARDHSYCHNHSYSLRSDSSGHWRQCSCGSVINSASHSGGTITCLAGASCSTCGYVYTAPAGHSMGYCCVNGQKCSNCSYKDHNSCHWHDYVLKQDASTHWEECNCGSVINTASHSGGTAYCLVGKICSTCSREYTAPLGHNMTYHCVNGKICTRCSYKDHSTCHWHSYELMQDANGHWDECNCGSIINSESHYGGTAYCTVGKICSKCSREYTAELGHSWSSTYTQTSTDHYIECVRVIGSKCTAIKDRADHLDSNPLNGRCDTCNYITDRIAPTMTCNTDSMYRKSHTATITFKDTGGAFLNPGTYTISYSWTTSTATPTSYTSSKTMTVGSNVRETSTTITKSDGTGTYYLHVKVSSNFTDTVGNAGNSTAGGASALFNFDNTPPTIKIDSSTEYKKSQTATITIEDTGGSGLSGSCSFFYAWTTDPEPPSYFTNFSSSKLSVGGMLKHKHTTTLTKDDGTGIYYLHVKFTSPITDYAGNESGTTLRGTFYLDNTAPTIELTPAAAYTPISIRDAQGVEFKVIDKHVGIETKEFTADDINVYVSGKESAAQKKVEFLSVESGVYKYKLTLSNMPETGEISFNIPQNAVADKLGNSSVQTDFAASQTNLFADNSNPEISLNGPIKVASITAGKNISNTIDPRYINSEYEIEIPILVKDVSGLDLKEGFDTEDIQVYVDSDLVTPTKEVILNKEYTQADTATGLLVYYKEYTLKLSGIKKDGYLLINVAAGSIVDAANNTNAITGLKPYARHNGADVQVYVDNTIPRIVINEVIGNGIMDSQMSVIIVLQVKDFGAGIRNNEFAAEDINVQIDGKTVTLAAKELIASSSNEYDSALGGDVITNYTYDLVLSGIDESGVLRLEIPTNKVIDKANNGNEVVTLTAEIKIDNQGPKLGRISSNADEQGEVIGTPVIVTIVDCVDESGIESYVWQRSKDKNNWEDIKVENSSLSSSTLEQEYKEDNGYYYRVIVSDTLGNTSISDVIKVDFRNSIDGKPTIRLEEKQISSELVEITAVIKSKLPIEKITVNGSEIAKSKYEDNITKNNFEYTTLMTYEATDNGVYEFEVIDERGNMASESINISIIDSTKAMIDYEKYDVTILSPAKIVFTSNEPVRIIDPNGYSGITFKETNFATKIEATISSGESFVENRIFIFENKGLMPTEVEVEAPIITRLTYVRFDKISTTNLGLTLKEISVLVDTIPLSKIMNAAGLVESYYGFNKETIKTQIATKANLDLAEKLGNATETFVIDENGYKVPLEKDQAIS
ncbi:MAG: hypothetical protein IJX99_05785, partial [Clostridia bacterium]|nr:hypothetical protein [Clostridia bacterium]